MSSNRRSGGNDSGVLAPAVGGAPPVAPATASQVADPSEIASTVRAASPLVDLRKNQLPFLIVLAVTLMAKAGALLPGHALDDYANLNQVGDALIEDVIRKGRLGHWLFLKVAVALQVEPNTARILYVSLAIVAYAYLGLAVTRFWKLPRASWLTIAAACMVANHPYTAEIFTFRVGLPPAAIVMALLGLLVHLASASRSQLLLGSVTFGAALSFYPIALHFGLMIALMAVLLDATRWLSGTGPPPGEREPRPPRTRLRLLLGSSNARLFLSIALGTLGYVIASKIIVELFFISLGDPERQWREVYFGILSPSKMPARFVEAAGLVANTFCGENRLIPPAVQLCFAVVLTCAVLGILWCSIRGSRRPLSAAAAFGAFALLAFAFLWTVGVHLVRMEAIWAVPRSMAHAGILWAGCLALAGFALPRAQPILLGTAAVILFSFVGVNQHMLEEQRRLNVRDFLQANRIMARLEAIPGAERVRRVVVVGSQGWHPAGPPRTQWGDINVSALGAYWSNAALLREATGYNLRWPTHSWIDLAENEAGKAYCAKVDPWPAAESVAIRGDLAFLCITQR